MASAVATTGGVANGRKRPLPWLTFGIIGLLILTYGAECRFNVGADIGAQPGPNSLVALGAVSRQLLDANLEPWRLVTAVLLHANLAHLVGNCLALLMAGAMLESMVGRAWFGAVFVISGVAGALASSLGNPPNMPSVGASGAITGLLGAAIVCSFHPSAAKQRVRNLLVCARLAVPALIPFAKIQGVNIDYYCHAGGFAAGAAMGLLMLNTWSHDGAYPDGVGAAAGVGLGGLAMAGMSFILVAAHYPAYAAIGEPYATVPLPKLTSAEIQDSGAEAHLTELVERYPRDPRTHAIRSIYYLRWRILDRAEADARAAIAAYDAGPKILPTGLEEQLHLLLALVVFAEGRRQEAASEAAPWCDKPYADAGADQLRQTLLSSGICVGPASSAAPAAP